MGTEVTGLFTGTIASMERTEATVAAMLKALKFKDMATAMDAMEHGGYNDKSYDLHDIIGCGCCSAGPMGVWYDSWDTNDLLRGNKDKSSYRYLSDKDYLLRLNPDFINRKTNYTNRA